MKICQTLVVGKRKLLPVQGEKGTEEEKIPRSQFYLELTL